MSPRMEYVLSHTNFAYFDNKKTKLWSALLSTSFISVGNSLYNLDTFNSYTVIDSFLLPINVAGMFHLQYRAYRTT